MTYALLLLNYCGIWIILAMSYNLLLGYGRLFSVTHAAFMGVGAYASALVATRLGADFLVGLGAGLLGSIALGALISIPALRVKDDYLFIATLGFQMIIVTVAENLTTLTGGVNGISGIPGIRFFGMKTTSYASFLVVNIVLVGICCTIVWRLVRSPFGRVLKAMREDEIATQSLGKNPVAFKVWVFIVSGMLASIAGSLYAHLISFIEPASFSLQNSIDIMLMVILGGAANLWGPVLGAVIMVLVPEVITFLDLPSTVVAPLRQVLFNLVLLLLLVFRPQGLLPEHKNATTAR